jgi:hypothetical protein
MLQFLQISTFSELFLNFHFPKILVLTSKKIFLQKLLLCFWVASMFEPILISPNVINCGPVALNTNMQILALKSLLSLFLQAMIYNIFLIH